MGPIDPARPIGTRFVSWLAALLLRGLGATWRVETEGRNPLLDPERRADAQIGALWHQNILMAAWLFRDGGHCVGVSASRDGDWIDALLGHLGYAPSARGSSTRGGISLLRGLARAVRAGVTTAVMVDGPHGPARAVKPGVVALAGLTGRPITLVALSCKPAHRFRSWDGTLLPLPFARVRVAFAEPIAVAKTPLSVMREEVRAHVEAELGRMNARLDRALGVGSRAGC